MKAEAKKIESIADRLSRSTRAVKADDLASEIQKQLGENTVGAIYKTRILSQRTRLYELNASSKPAGVEILHTLLGIELKIGNRRLLCPDLATARYLSVFARIGCEAVAVPYDITQVSRIADELESSWHRMMVLVDHFTVDRTRRLRSVVKQRLINDARAEIAHLGAGTKFPQFNQKTRQRGRGRGSE